MTDAIQRATSEPLFRDRFAFIIPCMGRKKHAQQSLPALLANPKIDGKHNFCVFVDFFCSDSTGDWVEQEFGERVNVFRMAKHSKTKGMMPIFNKPMAHNSGALEALNLGAQYFVFLDVDTVVSPYLVDHILQNASMDRFMIFEPSKQFKDLTGFVVTHYRPFIRINGFNTAFKGWGAEDLEFRLHLYLQGRAPRNQPHAVLQQPERFTMQWDELPKELARAIPHGDEDRVANYTEKDKEASHDLNLNLLCSNVVNWTGVHPIQLHTSPLGPSVRRLLGMDQLINPRAVG